LIALARQWARHRAQTIVFLGKANGIVFGKIWQLIFDAEHGVVSGYLSFHFLIGIMKFWIDGFLE
jgi:hypothetical protein